MTEAENQSAIDMSKADEKNAKLKLHLRANSGYSSDVECRVSANQWAAILSIIENGAASHVVPLCVCGKGASVTELDGQFLCKPCADAWVLGEGQALSDARTQSGSAEQ